MLRRLKQAVGRRAGRGLLATVAVAVGLAAVAAGHAATSAVSLLKVRMGGDATETRTVIELDGSSTARVLSDGAVDRQVVILLPGVTAAQVQQGAGRGVIKAWMVDQTPGGARLRIDLAADGKLKRRFLLPPADGVTSYRYVIDIAAAPGVVMTGAPTGSPK